MLSLLHTLLIWRVLTWKPSNIVSTIYCDDIVNGTIDKYSNDYIELVMNYDSNITFSNCDSTFDTQMTIFDTNHNDISSKYCDGDDCPENESKCSNKATMHEQFTIPLSIGIYYISIKGFSTDNGLYIIRTSCSHIENTMITINASFICNELLIDNIDIIYNIDYNACVYDYCLNIDECVMINYINSFKSATDSRCYLFHSQCDIIRTDTDNSYIAIKTSNNKECNDFPLDWMDSLGDTCYHYNILGWCYDGDMDRNVTMSDLEAIKDTKYGLTANDVCCECGGGIYNIDNVEMKFMYSMDIMYLQNMDYTALCPKRYQQNHPNWNKLNLYQLCIAMDLTQYEADIDCNLWMDAMYTNNISFVECKYDAIQNESLYFEFILTMISDNEDETVVYINSEWFDIDDYIVFSYNDCLDDLFTLDYNQLYMILPCDTRINTNISFANTTKIYTTNVVDKISTDKDAIQFLLRHKEYVIFISGFVFVIGILILFMICFWCHSNKKEKETKIEFSKLRNEMIDEMNRRSSAISLEGWVDHGLDETDDDNEQKIAIIRNEDEETASDNNRCLLCYDKRANTVLLPCGHVSFCNRCVKESIQNDCLCPQCRRKISDWKQIFRGGFRL